MYMFTYVICTSMDVGNTCMDVCNTYMDGCNTCMDGCNTCMDVCRHVYMYVCTLCRVWENFVDNSK
jgi:hypothetical protein